MMHIRQTIILTLILLLGSKATAQKIHFSEAERTIIRLQDERRGTDTIVRYLGSQDENVAWRAAVALANIKDTTTRKALLSHLKKDANPRSLEGVCFALGVLGPNTEVFQALNAFASTSASNELYIALGRTVPKDELPSLVQTLMKSTAPPMGVASALIEISLRRLMNEDLAKLVDALSVNHDPQVLWRAIYAYARCDDSTLLSSHLTSIRTYLGDLGSAESRMHAATALGRIHNEEAGQILINAARSEVDWRVRINILNAIAKLPRYNSAIHAVLKKAVSESLTDSLTSNHVARTALDVLDQMIAAGKVSSPDSVSIKEWLSDYLPSRELYPDQSLLIRSQALIPLARFGADYTTVKEIVSNLSYHNRTVNLNVWRAVGLVPDTLTFFFTINRVFATSPNDLPYLLDALHSIWELAKQDTSLLSVFEEMKYANLYRHMLIRFASHTEDPAIVANTLEQIKDPLIITDSLRSEAEEYLLQYLDKYAYKRYHDQLTQILSAVTWLGPRDPAFGTRIESLMNKAAAEWGDPSLVDSAAATLHALGVKYVQPKVALIREPIDWKIIENLPDTFLVSTQYGFMYLKPKPHDAPLTCLNMYKLAKINFFANNYIHRIVPNFVIQSGDNSGTGEGGPGYSIRTEISPLRYDDMGAVGMASSGKDTEGSQWFVTQSPTPHLNTRYTIWGEIVRGRDNIEKYMLNDQIININPYK